MAEPVSTTSVPSVGLPGSSDPLAEESGSPLSSGRVSEVVEGKTVVSSSPEGLTLPDTSPAPVSSEVGPVVGKVALVPFIRLAHAPGPPSHHWTLDRATHSMHVPPEVCLYRPPSWSRLVVATIL